MSVTVGGTLSIRNANVLDYCWRQSVESILPVCDSITICDGHSDDGTWEEIVEFSRNNPKIRIIRYPWPPKTKVKSEVYLDWMNFTREHVQEDYHLQIDADEVLDPDAIQELLRYKSKLNPQMDIAFEFELLNFWRDAQHLVPHGYVCGFRVIRFAPARIWLPCDWPHPKGRRAMDLVQHPDHNINLFHYGYLRKRSAMIEKVKVASDLCGEGHFLNQHRDKILASLHHDDWSDEIQDLDWTRHLVPYDGPHPAVMSEWLKERGYNF